jgi:hypothetical protein
LGETSVRGAASTWAEILKERFSGRFFVKEEFIMSGQLPYFTSHFSIARTGVYPIPTRQARQSAVEISGG